MKREEIQKIIEERHKNKKNDSEPPKSKKGIQNLDEFFANKINSILSKKCKNRSMIDIKDTFLEFKKDEDFDRKEFEFSQRMLRHQQKYSIGKIQENYLTDREEKERLNILHPRFEVRSEIKVE